MAKKKGKKGAAARARYAAAAAPAGLPGLAATGGREPSGRRSRALQPTADRDAPREALKARARQMGWLTGRENPADKDDQRTIARAMTRARAQSLEGEAGRAIHAACAEKEERDRLWEAWADFSSARLAYHRRILGAMPFPAMPRAPTAERIESGADEPQDDRTPEERDEDTAKRWAWWTRRLLRIDPAFRDVLRDAVAGTTPLVHDGRLTSAGVCFIAACRAIARPPE